MTNAQGVPDFNVSVTGIVSPWRGCHSGTPLAHRAKRKPDQAVQRGRRQYGIETLLAGDVDSSKAILRDYIKATVGFEQLGAETGASPKSLIRMFGPTGNPQARNLFSVISHLQRHAGLTLRVTARSN